MSMHKRASREDELHVLSHNNRLNINEFDAFTQTQGLAMVESYTSSTLLGKHPLLTVDAGKQ